MTDEPKRGDAPDYPSTTFHQRASLTDPEQADVAADDIVGSPNFVGYPAASSPWADVRLPDEPPLGLDPRSSRGPQRRKPNRSTTHQHPERKPRMSRVINFRLPGDPPYHLEDVRQFDNCPFASALRIRIEAAKLDRERLDAAEPHSWGCSPLDVNEGFDIWLRAHEGWCWLLKHTIDPVKREYLTAQLHERERAMTEIIEQIERHNERITKQRATKQRAKRAGAQ
jgi:hypothetical protein